MRAAHDERRQASLRACRSHTKDHPVPNHQQRCLAAPQIARRGPHIEHLVLVVRPKVTSRHRRLQVTVALPHRLVKPASHGGKAARSRRLVRNFTTAASAGRQGRQPRRACQHQRALGVVVTALQGAPLNPHPSAHVKALANHWYIMGPKNRGMPSSRVRGSVSVRCAIMNLLGCSGRTGSTQQVGRQGRKHTLVFDKLLKSEEGREVAHHGPGSR